MERRQVVSWLAVTAAVGHVVVSVWWWARYGAPLPALSLSLSALVLVASVGALVAAAWVVRRRAGRVATAALAFLVVYGAGHLAALLSATPWRFGWEGPDVVNSLRMVLLVATGAVAATLLPAALRRETRDAHAPARWLTGLAAALLAIAPILPIPVDQPAPWARNWFRLWEAYGLNLWMWLAPVVHLLVLAAIAVSVLRLCQWAWTAGAAAALSLATLPAVVLPLQDVAGVHLPMGPGYVLEVAGFACLVVALGILARGSAPRDPTGERDRYARILE